MTETDRPLGKSKLWKCVIFCILFFSFTGIVQETYRLIRMDKTKFTTITLITNYNEKKKKLRYTTLQGLEMCYPIHSSLKKQTWNASYIMF